MLINLGLIFRKNLRFNIPSAVSRIVRIMAANTRLQFKKYFCGIVQQD
jgi:hypothetical protein